MHEYLRQFGFDPEECQAIVWAYHEARGGGAVRRADLQLALQEQLEGLGGDIEQLVDEGMAAGDAYENFDKLGVDARFFRTLIGKVGGLSDQQIADIGIYCLRFWEQQPPSNS
jgi:hypothetical protein